MIYKQKYVYKKHFKAVVGFTPSEYKKQKKN